MKEDRKKKKRSSFQNSKSPLACNVSKKIKIVRLFCEDPFLTNNTSLSYSMPFKKSKRLSLHPLITSYIPPRAMTLLLVLPNNPSQFYALFNNCALLPTSIIQFMKP